MKKNFFPLCIMPTLSYPSLHTRYSRSVIACAFEERITQIILVFHSLNRTFAAVKETTRRYYSAWVLLAVFLPMLVLSSLHVHPVSLEATHRCEECVHHKHHSDHIGTMTTCSFDCVLCQFLTLPFLAATAVIFTANIHQHRSPLIVEDQRVVKQARGLVSLRAPPVR